MKLDLHRYNHAFARFTIEIENINISSIKIHVNKNMGGERKRDISKSLEFFRFN